MHQQHTWHLRPDVQRRARSLLTRAATDPVWYGCLFSSSYGKSRARYNLTEPTPLQVVHVAVEFIVEPFCPSGLCLRTMKISAQWCRVDTNYFTHNLETRTGPKNLPTALKWTTTLRGAWKGKRNLDGRTVITNEGSKPEVISRIAQTTAALTRLKPVWNDRSISLSSTIRLMRSLATSIFLYVCESWAPTAELRRRIKL